MNHFEQTVAPRLHDYVNAGGAVESFIEAINDLIDARVRPDKEIVIEPLRCKCRHTREVHCAVTLHGPCGIPGCKCEKYEFDASK